MEREFSGRLRGAETELPSRRHRLATDRDSLAS